MQNKWSPEGWEVQVIVGICKMSETVPEAMRAIRERFPWATQDSVVNFLRRRGQKSPKWLVAKPYSTQREVKFEEVYRPPPPPPPVESGDDEEPPSTLKSQRHPVFTPPQDTADRFWLDQEDPDDYSPIIQPKNPWVSKRVLLIPDTHRPYHSRRAFQVMLKAAAEILRPDTIVVLGDFGDFYATSQHDKDPRRASRLKEELDDVSYGLDILDSLPGVRRKVYCAGNHEWRQARYISKYAPSLDGLVVSWEDYLRLGERGWELIPYKRIGVVGNLLVTHETGIGGVHAPKRVLDLAAGMGATDIAFGHTHRLGMATLGSLNGRPRLSISCGWLGSHKSADYIHAIQAFSHYNHGFAYAVADDTGHLIPGLAYIYGSRAHLLGKTVCLPNE